MIHLTGESFHPGVESIFRRHIPSGRRCFEKLQASMGTSGDDVMNDVRERSLGALRTESTALMLKNGVSKVQDGA